MILSVGHQGFVFLVSIILGIFIGLFYDFFRFIRKIIYHNNFATYIEDLIFWILVIFVSYVTVLHISNGEIRFYFFIGVLIGYILYFLIISDFILSLFMNVYKALCNLLKVFVRPLGLAVKKCYTPSKFVFKKLKRAKYSTKVLLKKNIFYGKISLRRLINNIKMIFNKI